jgi:hypothetical protein
MPRRQSKSLTVLLFFQGLMTSVEEPHGSSLLSGLMTFKILKNLMVQRGSSEPRGREETERVLRTSRVHSHRMKLPERP